MGQGMPDPVLLRSQKNEVFMVIKKGGLEPSDFQWSEVDNGNGLRLTHTPTDSYFIFDISNGWWKGRYFPSQSKAAEDFFGHTHTSWPIVLENFESWLSVVRREYAEPDLWAASQQEKKLIAEKIDDLENSPFSETEQSRIAIAVNELREFLIFNAKHSDSQVQFVTTRLQHLEEASHRLGRKDWITLAMGTLTNIVVGAALAPDAARELLRTAGSLFGWVVGNIHLLS